MGRFVVLLVLLLTAAQAQAITWNFDQEGKTQGWLARDSGHQGPVLSVPYRTEVVDGIWRIFLPPFEEGRQPAFELTSPVLRHDSALFDQLRLRFRIVHTGPLQGQLYFLWTNATNRNMPVALGHDNPDSVASGFSYLLYSRFQPQVYKTEWQEVVIGGLQPEVFPLAEVFSSAKGQCKLMWEGELDDVRLWFLMYSGTVAAPFEPHAAAMPEAVEVDWIQLTGIEEQMQGELPPPTGAGAISLGQYFEPPVFYPVDQPGLGLPSSYSFPTSALGDVDGDGDKDLAAEAMGMNGSGWVSLENDGQGVFGGDVRVEPSTRGTVYFLDGADLNGDGCMEVLVGAGAKGYQVLENRKGEGWVPILEGEDPPRGLADLEGDGDVDLWLLRYQAEGDYYLPLIRRNDGQGHFDQGVGMAPELIQEERALSRVLSQVSGTRVGGILWEPYPDHGQGYKITYLDPNGEVVQIPLGTDVPNYWMRYVGDFDQDGDTDLAAVTSMADMNGLYRGLELLVNQGDGRLERVPWYGEEVATYSTVKFVDLDGDGILDPVFVDSNFRNPAVVVWVGQKDGLPIEEGRYPLEGPGGEVVEGDVDGDGDIDLVVLEGRHIGGGSGVHVLKNRLSERGTAVSEEVSSRPTVFHLGVNYPNPFNPQTWIPVEIPASGETVQLRVYNLLGQPIRTLVSGRLTPGHHAVPWDGRDERGATVSSGVYLYRLEAGAWSATGKMMRSE
jgi:hypothetical protein